MPYLKHILFAFLAIFTLIFKTNCSSNRIHNKANVKNIDYLIDKGNQLWEQRIDSTAFNKAEHFITLAYEQNKNDFSLAVLLSQLIYTKAYFYRNNNSDSLFLHSSNLCKNAVFVK